MFKKILVAFGFVMLSTTSFAECVGSAAYRTCYDSSGNNYTVSRSGNSTSLYGTNARTGSSWSQQSQTSGNMTTHYGQTNGRSWNATETRSPGMRQVYGTNSRGKSFNYTCTTYGGCN